MKRKVRVRFAPSPTGPLHMGGVRTALFNFLFAKKHGGDFILRIEDTDQNRYVDGAEEYIIESLKWCGLNFDEGVGVGGEHSPYRQSERKNIYRQYAMQLVESGNAYYAFDSAEELEKMREIFKAENEDNQQYNALTRKQMKNSLTLPETETHNLLNAGEPYVIRFKMPENENVVMQDIIRGEVIVNTANLDDKVLYKSDGMPTYHLANVVDDYLMKISHVIRGEEWLPSLPLHVLLYRSFGWSSQMPEFAHLPLLLKPVGKGKLSKRDGDQMGFPVFPLQWKDPKTGDISSGYRESGYFPDAFINILALLGWNSGTEQEIFTLEQLIEIFSLEKVGKSGSKFDPDKAKWYNHQYLVRKSNAEIAHEFEQILAKQNISVEFEKLEKICSLVKERVNFVHELWEQSSFFFVEPQSYDEKTIKKKWKPDSATLLSELSNLLGKQETFGSHELETVVKEWIEKNELNMGNVMTPLRIALVGAQFGPHLFDIIEIIGKNETLKRIETAIKKIDISK